MSNQQQQVGYVVKQAQSLLRLRMEEALHPYALTVSQYSCLHRLLRDPGISAAALARATFMTRQSMNSMLQQLLERGLVDRPARPESGRALPTALTAAGADLLAAAQADVDGVEERMLSGLSPSELISLTHGLNACVKALGG
ncbi:MarR family winged helix-turn-helix transcriptional regulator [Arthrobacter glacialis]|uniref:MarR family winged helix-turn-helix transcriptional regulator n=1 Tax=Arthrobacter glacialis TaxID=1664 RepID=UPI000CD41917|nr:MarR family transcriptional regulator [Arthrobacter glacialis]POH58359.1 MarR family transcriptional regulator [Arthrobacter glacialis]